MRVPSVNVNCTAQNMCVTPASDGPRVGVSDFNQRATCRRLKAMTRWRWGHYPSATATQ